MIITPKELTLDDATQFIRKVLWGDEPATLFLEYVHPYGWLVYLTDSASSAHLIMADEVAHWDQGHTSPTAFPAAQAALNAAMATDQITEAG